ncbi:MAG: DUF4340 domain-containing protein [Brevinema sp.]
MKNKNIILSVTLIIIGVAIFAYKKNTQVTLKKNILVMPWSNIRKDKLMHIETTMNKGTNAFRYDLKKDQGTWYLDSPIQIMAQQDKSLILVNEFMNLRPRSVLSNISEEEFDSFGLKNPSIKVAGIFRDEGTNFFIVGNKTSVGDQYYVATAEKTDTVYLIDNQTLSYFINGVSHLVDTYFISKPIDQVVSVSLKTFSGEKFTFTNNQQMWEQISPATSEAVDWGVRKFLLQAKDLRFNPESITFNTSDENLRILKINTQTSPMLTMNYSDGSSATFYVGTEERNKHYPIYSISQKLISFSSTDSVAQIFKTTKKDFEIKKN